MSSEPLPATAVVVRFIDCINRGDVDGLGRLMTEDHELVVFDEPPLRGRIENITAWHGYVEGFPEYAISAHRISERDGRVAVLGHTTASHLGLPDDEERELTLIWLADVRGHKIHTWRLVEDTADRRDELGL